LPFLARGNIPERQDFAVQHCLKIEGVAAGVVSFATGQSSIPAIRELVISNPTDEYYTDLTLTIKSDPGFALPWTARIGALPPGQRALISPVRIFPTAEFLAALDENIEGAFDVILTHGQQELANERFSLTLATYQSWPGLKFFPETLAAHVRPGHPLIHKFLQVADRTLSDMQGKLPLGGYSPSKLSLSGYADCGNIGLQLGAIFKAVAKENIKLAEQYPTYNKVVQSISPVDGILHSKTATPLELTLFYASCLEAAGLNPLLVFDGSRVLAGCHLEDKLFPEAMQSDSYMLAGKISGKIPEILLIDLAAMSAKGGNPFVAAKELSFEQGKFFVLDIARARLDGIHPLPIRKQLPDGSYTLERPRPPQNAPDSELSDIQRWEDKLFDFSPAHDLLDLHRQSALQILPGRLEQTINFLLEGAEFSFSHAPENLDAVLKDEGAYEAKRGDKVEDLVVALCRAGRLHSFFDADKTQRSLTQIYRLANLDQTERLRKTLHLAAGFLRWYESDTSERPRLAPLLLFPAELTWNGGSYRLRLCGKEPVLNRALLEALRKQFKMEIKGLSDLEITGSPVSIKAVLNAFRQTVVGKQRWSVKEHIFLGTFDISRFLLWEDFKLRAQELSSRPVAQSLLNGELSNKLVMNSPEPDSLDTRYLPSDICAPLSADCSQLRAVCAAGDGGSFILSGPAGSGKTQTVINITANMLSRGKRVLILSSKQSALQDAQRRLESIGLDPFCLSAWENRGTEDILPAIERIVALGKVKRPEDYKRQAENLHAARQDLNAQMEALHRTQPCGFSLFQAISIYQSHKDAPDGVEIPPELPGLLDEETHPKWQELIGELADAAKACGSVSDHPLSAFRNAKFSPSLIVGITGIWRDYRQALIDLQQETEQLRGVLALPAFETKEKYIAGDKLCEFLFSCPPIPPRLYAYNKLSELQWELEIISELGADRDKLENELLESFSPEILNFDEDEARDLWQKAEATWVLPRTAAQKKIIDGLGGIYRKPTSLLHKEDIPALFDKITIYKARAGEFERRAPLFAELFGPLWKESTLNFEQLKEICSTALQLNELLSTICPDAASKKKTNMALAGGFFYDLAAFRTKNSSTLRQYRAAWSAIPPMETTLSKQMRGAFTHFSGIYDWLGEMRQMTETWLDNQIRLREWCNYLTVRERAVESGIATVANALESDVVKSSDDLLPAFYKALFAEICEQIIKDEALLQTFGGSAIEEDVGDFARLNERFETLTFRELAATLSARAFDAMNKPTLGAEQVGILRGELENGGPVDAGALMRETPDIFPQLFPCMLMSPTFAARLIPTDSDYPPFDLVIFDEASLTEDCEALGALSMGRSAIMAGDITWLRPSPEGMDGNMFRKKSAPSILESCRALGMPEIKLGWHYRSRHQSLFAFAGARFYGGQPLIYPSPQTPSRVKLLQVYGRYLPGSRQNEAEADAVVAEIAARLSAEKGAQTSLGVVTLCPQQRDLIQDKLDALLLGQPDLAATVRQLSQPLLVKYAGHWQGETRGIILLSITFGLDQKGKLPARWGILSSRDGWRLLCLALTRASRELFVYSSLSSEQIDADSSGTEGIVSLRAFLQYAQDGAGALPLRPLPSPGYIGALEQAVATFVHSLGYQTRRDVGASGFRVDVAVLHPEDSERYILAIMCDGQSYRAAATAKDRLILQDAMLAQKGWNLHRVWALEWLNNPEKEMKRIETALAWALVSPGQERETPLPRILPESYEREETPVALQPESEFDEPEMTEEIYSANPEPDFEQYPMFEQAEPVFEHPEQEGE